MGTPKTQLWVQFWDNGQRAQPQVCAVMCRHQDPPQPPSRDSGEPWARPWGGSTAGLFLWPLTGCGPHAGIALGMGFWGGQLLYPHLRALWGLSRPKAGCTFQGAAAAPQN